MDPKGGKRTASQRGAARGNGPSRADTNSRGMGSSRGIVSPRGVRGWKGKRGRGSSRGRKVGSTPEDPNLPPVDVPETSGELTEAIPQDKSTGTCRDKTDVVQLLQSTIAMREQLAAWPGQSEDKHTSNDQPFLESLAAEAGGSGASERLNVFEQFKIPFDTSEKQNAASEVSTSQCQEKSAAGMAIKKTFQKSTSDAVGKKPVELARRSSMEEETKEVFDSRELSDMCKETRVIKVIKRVRGWPRQLDSSSDISLARRQSSNVAKSVGRGQFHGGQMARGKCVARSWSAGHATQTTDKIETFGRPAAVSGRRPGRPRGRRYLASRTRGKIGPVGHSTFQRQGSDDSSTSQGQTRSRGRPRSRSRPPSVSYCSSTVSSESPKPCDTVEPCDNTETSTAAGATLRGSAASRSGSASRRSSVSTKCGEVEDGSDLYVWTKCRGRGRIRENILWKYHGRGHTWQAKYAQCGLAHSQRRRGRGRGRGHGRSLPATTPSLPLLTGDSTDVPCPASAGSSQDRDIQSTEADSVVLGANQSVNEKAKRTSSRACRAQGRDRGGVGRGGSKIPMVGRKSKMSLLVAAKKVLQESSVKILKKKKKKKIKRLFTTKKKRTAGLGIKAVRKKPLKRERMEDSVEVGLSQDSVEVMTKIVPALNAEIAERVTEEIPDKKVKRKYHRRTNNSTQVSVFQDNRQTDMLSEKKTEALGTGATNTKPGETTVVTSMAATKKVKRKYVRKTNISQSNASQSARKNETSSGIKTEGTVAVTSSDRPVVRVKRKYVRKIKLLSASQASTESGTLSVTRTENPVTDRTGGVTEGMSDDRPAMRVKRKYTWRLLSKLSDEKRQVTAAGKLGKRDLKKVMKGSEKPAGRKKKKPKTLTKLALRTTKPRGAGGSSKKTAQGVLRDTSQTLVAVKQTNSTSDAADVNVKVDNTNSAKNGAIALSSGQVARKTAPDCTKTVKTGRKAKAQKMVANSGDPTCGRDTTMDCPPSPARSCDSFSSNEPLNSLRPDHRSADVDTDKQVRLTETTVETNSDKTGGANAKPVKQTNDAPDLKETGSTDNRGENSSIKNTETGALSMKEIIETSDYCDKNMRSTDSATTDVSSDVKADTSDVSHIATVTTVAPAEDLLSPHPTSADNPAAAQDQTSSDETKRKRRRYKRRSALELLNDVDGPPSRTQRLMQTKSKRLMKERYVDPDTTPGAETAAADTATRCPADKAPTQEETDSGQETISEPIDDTKPPAQVPPVAESADSTAEEKTNIISVKKVENVMEKFESNTEENVSISTVKKMEGFVLKGDTSTTASTTMEDVKSTVAFMVDKVERCAMEDRKSTGFSTMEKAKDFAVEDVGSTSPAEDKVEISTREGDQQSAGKGKKRLPKKITEEVVGSENKGPRKKYKAAKPDDVKRTYKVMKRSHKEIKRKYKAYKPTDNERIAHGPLSAGKRQKLKGDAAEDDLTGEIASASEGPPPKSYSVKRMTTRGKKNRYWYLFAKQTKMPSAADSEADSSPRSGSVENMLGVCKPCRVMLVDFLKCLNISRLTAITGEITGTPPESEVTAPTEMTEPAAKVTKVDTCMSVEADVDEPLVDGDNTILTSNVTEALSQRTDASSPSSPEDMGPLDTSRIPRPVGTDETLSSQKRQKKPLRRFQCNVCAFKTSIRSLMDEHVYTHTNVEPYSCGHCGKAFGTRDGVVKHTRLDHRGQLFSIMRRRQRRKQGSLAESAYYTVQYKQPKQTVKAAAPTSVDAESPVADGSRVRPRIPKLDGINLRQPYYQCKRCTYATNSVVTIQHHVLDVHSSDRRLICALCDRAYCKTEHGMTKHYKRWHADATVQLRYEPDYYEVWDVKEAEANGVDAASCTVLALPGAGGDASAQLLGQPLIGQPLIVQPGQTFLSQKVLSSERPHITQPLTLQPSVRAASRGRPADRALDDNSRSVSGKRAVELQGDLPANEHTTSLNSPERNTNTFSAESYQTHIPPMPQLYSVDTHVTSPANVVGSLEPLTVTTNSSDGTGSADTNDTSEGNGNTGSTTENPARKVDEPLSVAAVRDDERGLAFSMPRLVKSASHEQSGTEELPPLVPCVLPIAPGEGASADQSTWPATDERTNDGGTTADDKQSELSDATDALAIPVSQHSDRTRVETMISAALEKSTDDATSDLDTVDDTTTESPTLDSYTTGDSMKGDAISGKGLDTHGESGLASGSEADFQDGGKRDPNNGVKETPDVAEETQRERKGASELDDAAPCLLSGTEQGEMVETSKVQLSEGEDTEHERENVPVRAAPTDSVDSSVSRDSREASAMNACSSTVNAERTPTGATSMAETSDVMSENKSSLAAASCGVDSNASSTTSGNSIAGEVTSATDGPVSNCDAVTNSVGIREHSTNQATHLPHEDGLPTTSNRKAVTPSTVVASTDVCSDRDSCASLTARATTDTEDHGPSSETLVSTTAFLSDNSVADTTVVGDASVVIKLPESTTNGSDKSGKTTPTANNDRLALPPCSIVDVRSLAPQLEPLIQCLMCPLRLCDQEKMVSHISTKHNVDVWYACPYCQLGCSPQRANIVCHIQKSHASQPLDVPINIVNSDKYFRLTTTSEDITSSDLAMSINLLSGTMPTPVTSTVSTSAPVMTNVTIGQVIMMAYHDNTPDSVAVTKLGTSAILPRTTVPASMTLAGAARLTVTSGTDLRYTSSSSNIPLLGALTTEAGGGLAKTVAGTATNSVNDDDDIIFVASQPGSKRRVVAVRSTLQPGVSASALQAELRRPVNVTSSAHHVTTSVRHPIMSSSVPVARPAHTGLAAPVNRNHIGPPNSYMSPVGPTSQAFQYHALGNIRPAHMNNVVSNVGAPARPAHANHANHATPVMRRGPPPLIPLTLLEAGRVAVNPRQVATSTAPVRMMIPGVGAVARPMAPHRPPPAAVINIADDDDDDVAIKESFSVFNLRPRLRTPSVVYRSPGGGDIRRPAVGMRRPPPPYPTQRQVAPPLARRPPPAAHQFAPVARPAYNGSRTQVKCCPHCPYESDNPPALHDHILSHGSIVKWACPYCSVPPQPSKDVVAEHIRKVHPRFPVVYKPFGL